MSVSMRDGVISRSLALLLACWTSSSGSSYIGFEWKSMLLGISSTPARMAVIHEPNAAAVKWARLEAG